MVFACKVALLWVCLVPLNEVMSVDGVFVNNECVYDK